MERETILISEFNHNLEMIKALLKADSFFAGLPSDIPEYIEKNFNIDEEKMINEINNLYKDCQQDDKDSLLSYMGRVKKSESCLETFKEALSDNILVRNAAVKALENIGTPLCLELLEEHEEQDEKLNNYITRVIDDLRT